LFKTKQETIKEAIQEFNWQNIYKKSFCVRVKGRNKLEKKFADLIFNKLKKPKVNLTEPGTEIHFFFFDNFAVAGRFIAETDKSYMKRKAHLRPKLHPTSMHPKLARACINLLGLKKGSILDPFCGSGGILIEAGLMGFNLTGYDIDKKQIERAKINLKHYKIRRQKLETKNSLSLNKKFDGIVTDFPYGKGSKGNNLEELYVKFMKHSYDYTDKMVVVMPNFADYKKIISKSRWKIKNKFEIYVHKSLTRIILQLLH
jgi:tRNA (guanine10-N2)-dimethyltransferase